MSLSSLYGKKWLSEMKAVLGFYDFKKELIVEKYFSLHHPCVELLLFIH